jgi:hypothetical protein
VTGALLFWAACDKQELGFTADHGEDGQPTTTGSSGAGAAVNEGEGTTGDDTTAGTGATGNATSGNATSGGRSGVSVATSGSASTSAGAGGAPSEPACELDRGRRLFGGYFASCVLGDDGSLACFGADDWSAPEASAPLVDVAINQDGACALQSDCKLTCFGNERFLATSPPSGGYTRLATAEGGIFCALDTAGELWCWGGPPDTPPVSLDGYYVDVAGGELGTFCALTEEGAVKCWDAVSGIGVTADKLGPYSKVAPADHTCALRVAGYISCWGNDYYGATSPPAGDDFVDVVSTHAHSCALTQTGSAVCWGGLYLEDEDPGLLVAPEAPLTSLVTGIGHMCGLTQDGQALCWGYGTRDSGQLPDLGQASPPDAEFSELAAGYWHTCGLTVTGDVECWGELGVGLD